MSWYLSTLYSYFGVIKCFIHLYFSASDDLRCSTLFVSPFKQYRNLRSKMLWEQAMKDLKDAEEDFIIADIHLRKSAMSVMPWYRCWLSGVGCWWILVSVLMLLSRVTSDVPSEPCHHPLSPPPPSPLCPIVAVSIIITVRFTLWTSLYITTPKICSHRSPVLHCQQDGQHYTKGSNVGGCTFVPLW